LENTPHPGGWDILAGVIWGKNIKSGKRKKKKLSKKSVEKTKNKGEIDNERVN
jgi:hypothetical protein